MKEEKAKDSLDQLFNKFLSDERAAENGWNVPSDQVFLDALEQIEEKPKRKILPLFWISFGLIVLIFGGFMLWSSTRIHNLDQELNQLQNKINTQSSNSPEQTNQAIPYKTDIQNIPSDGGVSNSINTNSVNIQEGNLQPLRRESKSIEDNTPPQTPEGNNKDKQSIIPQANNTTKPSQDPLLSQQVVQTVSRLPQAMAYAERKTIQEPLPTLINLLESPADKPLQKEAKWSASVFLGSRLSSFGMSKISKTGPKILGYDERQIGFNAGVGISHKIGNKWSMRHSLAYSRVNNKSYYEDDFVFDIEKQAQDAQGDNWYSSDKAIITPLGATSQDKPMAMSDAVILNDEVMQARTDVKLDFQMIEWGTGLQYELLRKNNWQWSIGTGMEVRYVASYKQWANIDVSKDQMLILNNEINNTERKDLNQWLLGISANTSLQYHWTDQLFSGVEIGGAQSLNSLRNNSNTIQTFMNDLRINLVSGFKF